MLWEQLSCLVIDDVLETANRLEQSEEVEEKGWKALLITKQLIKNFLKTMNVKVILILCW